MNIHKRTRLTLLDRQEIWRLYQTRLWKVAHLAERFHVSRPTIYDVLKRARLQEFTPRDSTNQRFKTLQYGLKRAAKRYNKSYPGELVHFDTKRLPLLKGHNPPINLANICLWPLMTSPGSCMPIFFPIKLSTAQLAFS